MTSFLATASRVSPILDDAVRQLKLPEDSPCSADTPREVHDTLRAAHIAYNNARTGADGASWSTARQLYEAYLRLPDQPAGDRAEATFFAARAAQQMGLIPLAR